MHILKKITTIALATTMFVGAAWADANSEAFVEENANAVLHTLNQPELTEADRTAQFNLYMNTFADMDKVARFAVGRYGRQFSDAEFKAYSDAFITYALAVYEVQLDRFRGEEIEVVGSVDLRPGDSVVKTRILATNDNKKFNVEWRVLKDKDSANYQVLDVALNIEGSQIWLAQEQRAQFVSLLDRSNGNAEVLIERINSMTEKLKNEKELAKNQLKLTGDES
ncbi:MlaC/ttg2D family ABC transporter substrate-binding protein [Hirschia baltica]|uniref:Toluene tolerance family protein n=1 Tax=Hirschia baltica (strain ATCC 49814 / DSM 5838 / IFAM 1418) TaxID=582402 RepID=C6XMC8_HIRBI|nr:ABC transporter substrate-binding protein [Hirschia baltica]ACT58071.1 toluene tolerance family protein [Hirschia baltica ATCC 49814]